MRLRELIKFTIIIAMVFLLGACPVRASELAVIGFNVESGEDTTPAKVVKDIEQMAGPALWGLTEVPDMPSAVMYTEAAKTSQSKFNYILGTSGNQDRLQIIYDENQLTLLATEELTEIEGSRRPLVARFQLLRDKTEFLFMVNHLERRNVQMRNLQAQKIRQWAEKQVLPIIAVGDYNFDWDIVNQSGNKAFQVFMKDDIWQWVKPKCLEDDSCPLTGTQCNRRYSSILDFIFVAGQAKQWQGTSEILFTEDAYCDWDQKGYSDHRPVIAIFRF